MRHAEKRRHFLKSRLQLHSSSFSPLSYRGSTDSGSCYLCFYAFFNALIQPSGAAAEKYLFRRGKILHKNVDGRRNL